MLQFGLAWFNLFQNDIRLEDMRGKKHDGVHYASLQDFAAKPASFRYDTRYTRKSSCHAAVAVASGVAWPFPSWWSERICLLETSVGYIQNSRNSITAAHFHGYLYSRVIPLFHVARWVAKVFIYCCFLTIVSIVCLVSMCISCCLFPRLFSVVRF